MNSFCGRLCEIDAYDYETGRLHITARGFEIMDSELKEFAEKIRASNDYMGEKDLVQAFGYRVDH